MRAAAIRQHGGPDVVEVVDLPEQELQEHQVRVEVRAAALNHLDLWVRRGWPGLSLTMPHVLGSDVAGVVESVGEQVSTVTVGEAVIVAPGFGCGACERCLSGQESLCPEYHIYGESVSGGMRQRMVVPERHLLPMPELSFQEAAAIPLTFMTAWHMLLQRGDLRAGETVLVQAAASGVGTAAVQIAKVTGARVIATASTEQKRQHARAMGADEVVDSSAEDWRKQVKRRVAGAGVDLVVEHVGGNVFEQSLSLLRPGGRLVTCGATIGGKAQLDLRHIFFKQLSIIGSTMGTRADLFQALKLFKAGQLKPVVYRVLPLSQIQQAQALLEERQTVGKVVIDLGE